MSKKILIVEDDPFIAMDLAEQLEEQGFKIIGPHPNVSAAMNAIEIVGCDIAVLDVNLGSETSEPIAEKLKAIGIPFVVVSGYKSGQRSEVYADAPAFNKPVSMDSLLNTLFLL